MMLIILRLGENYNTAKMLYLRYSLLGRSSVMERVVRLIIRNDTAAAVSMSVTSSGELPS